MKSKSALHGALFLFTELYFTFTTVMKDATLNPTQNELATEAHVSKFNWELFIVFLLFLTFCFAK